MPPPPIYKPKLRDQSKHTLTPNINMQSHRLAHRTVQILHLKE